MHANNTVGRYSDCISKADLFPVFRIVEIERSCVYICFWLFEFKSNSKVWNFGHIPKQWTAWPWQTGLIKLQHLRWVIDDCSQSIEQIYTLHCIHVHLHSCSLGLHVSDVVRLISKHGESHHRDPMVNGLIDSICSTMSDKSSGFGVSYFEGKGRNGYRFQAN